MEITFDNADGRIPIERDEVTLRRTVGLKCDEYELDGKRVNKTEVMKLLESSGFSRSNPYYIVQQGKIEALVHMRDGERLELLKEVAGTKVYDERRAQSVAILEDTKNKQERIEEVLAYIESRLAELEDEKDELKEFQELDRKKRGLEYAILEAELGEVRRELDRLDEARQAEAEAREATHTAGAEKQELLRGMAADTARAKAEELRLRAERSAIAEQRAERLALRAKLELDVAELRKLAGTDGKARAAAKADLAAVQAEIAAKEGELAALEPKLAGARAAQAQTQQAHDRLLGRQTELFARRSRSARFETAAARDKWIEGELRSVKKLQRDRSAQAAGARKEAGRLAADAATHAEEVLERRGQVTERKARIRAAIDDIKASKARRNQLQDAQNKKYREGADVERASERAKADFSAAERALYSTLSRAKREGVQSVSKLQAQLKLDGVHGPLIELVDCAEQYARAVEVTGADSLFNVVVDDDAIASRLIKEMNERKMSARITFLPLNRLSAKPPRLPTGDGVVAMHEKVQCDPKFQRAVRARARRRRRAAAHPPPRRCR